MHINLEDQRRTDLIIDLVALATQTDRGQFLMTRRGEAGVARARQVAMYLTHVACGYSLTKTGALFQRDKSTVGHAVRQIEDFRDCEAFEDWIGELENAVMASARLTTPPQSVARYFPAVAAAGR